MPPGASWSLLELPSVGSSGISLAFERVGTGAAPLLTVSWFLSWTLRLLRPLQAFTAVLRHYGANSDFGHRPALCSRSYGVSLPSPTIVEGSSASLERHYSRPLPAHLVLRMQCPPHVVTSCVALALGATHAASLIQHKRLLHHPLLARKPVCFPRRLPFQAPGLLRAIVIHFLTA